MNPILTAAIVLGALGLISGAILAFVGKMFAVKVDPRQAEIREVLPGINCAACGYPGCDSFAKAVAEKGESVSGCPVGGDATAIRVALIMGVTAEPREQKIAAVTCKGKIGVCALNFDYHGPKDCRSAALAGSGDKACQYSCLGYGDCEASCPFGAIHVVTEERLAYVNEEKCNGCGVCVAGCPRNVIRLLPVGHAVHRTCSAMEGGKVVRDHCSAGCLGCGKCERSCRFGALKMRDSLPWIDQTICVHCMRCADECPTGALKANNALRKHALIDFDECNGCGDCKKACQFSAIQGEQDKYHDVIEWNCVGCGECVKVCPQKCIRMVMGSKYQVR